VESERLHVLFATSPRRDELPPTEAPRTGSSPRDFSRGGWRLLAPIDRHVWAGHEVGLDSEAAELDRRPAISAQTMEENVDMWLRELGLFSLADW
jgi:hypothetical protein